MQHELERSSWNVTKHVETQLTTTVQTNWIEECGVRAFNKEDMIRLVLVSMQDSDDFSIGIKRWEPTTTMGAYRFKQTNWWVKCLVVPGYRRKIKYFFYLYNGFVEFIRAEEWTTINELEPMKLIFLLKDCDLLEIPHSLPLGNEGFSYPITLIID